jgi:hypothetical protein
MSVRGFLQPRSEGARPIILGEKEEWTKVGLATTVSLRDADAALGPAAGQVRCTRASFLPFAAFAHAPPAAPLSLRSTCVRPAVDDRPPRPLPTRGSHRPASQNRDHDLHSLPHQLHGRAMSHSGFRFLQKPSTCSVRCTQVASVMSTSSSFLRAFLCEFLREFLCEM